MWDGSNIIARMGGELGTLDRAIKRVTHYWDDRVSEGMQMGCIHDLAQQSVNAVDELGILCSNIEGLIEDMCFRAYR